MALRIAPRDPMPAGVDYPPEISEKKEETTADLVKLRNFLAHGAPGPHYYVVLLGLRIFSLTGLMRSVQRGLSYDTLARFQRNVSLPYDAIIDWLQISPRTLTRRKQEGRLSPEESDRLLRASRIFARAIELFEGDRYAATNWLLSPQRALGGAVPVEFAKSELGAREVEDLIGRLEHGVYS